MPSLIGKEFLIFLGVIKWVVIAALVVGGAIALGRWVVREMVDGPPKKRK